MSYIGPTLLPIKLPPIIKFVVLLPLILPDAVICPSACIDTAGVKGAFKKSNVFPVFTLKSKPVFPYITLVIISPLALTILAVTGVSNVCVVLSTFNILVLAYLSEGSASSVLSLTSNAVSGSLVPIPILPLPEM